MSQKHGRYEYTQEGYEKSLASKQREVDRLLSTYGKVHPIVRMESPFFYRNKATVQVGYNFKKKRPYLGKFAPNSHKIIETDDYLIENKKANEVFKTIIELMPSFKYRAYDEDRGQGLIRHIMIRNNQQDELMVVLVVGDIRFPSKKNFVRVLTTKHPEIKTIVLNVNNRKTSTVLGDREEVIYGPGWIKDSCLGLTFKISAQSFYQVNNTQTEIIYSKALELADLKGTELILDAYCGIGTIGLLASQNARKVVGVELNPKAVKDTKYNARLNDIKNAEFYQGDAGEFLALSEQQYDVLIMDPPRSGSDEKFLAAIEYSKPQKIVYISCNPKALARDVEVLIKQGYQPSDFYPIDNFPFTSHVETVVLMSQKGK